MPTNYPAALDSFTTKVDGVDDVLAADINKLQDAILALQGKLGVHGANLILRAATGSVDPPDLEFQSGTGVEIGRIWKDPASNEFMCRFSSVDTSKKIAHTGSIGSVIADGTAVGNVGSYIFACRGNNNGAAPGDFAAGAELTYTGASGFPSGIIPSGTWRCMGRSYEGNAGRSASATLWLRVA